ncbi:MAG TPA: LamG domain-containing protein [Gemmataceae bacterium]|nr:LamG domain-containing protein [Gemmataceae bacterium]
MNVRVVVVKRRLWLGALVAALAVPSLPVNADYSATVLADGPVGYWRLGDGASSATASDATGSGYDGIYTRGIASAPGPCGATAAAFDGFTAWITVPVGNGTPPWPFNFANGFTVEAWVINAGQDVNPPHASLGRIASNGNPGNIGWGFGILDPGRGEGLRFTTYGVKDYDSTMAIVPEDSTWHHVAVVFDSTNAANFYLDGVLLETIAGPGPVRSAGAFDLEIGRNPVSSAQEFFNGNIGEVAIYNYELTSGQILAHFGACH